MLRRINKLVNLLVLLGLMMLLMVGQSNPALAQNAEVSAVGILKPTVIVNLGGTVTGTVDHLFIKDQSGTADDLTKYVRFNTPNVNYVGYRKYTIPASISPGAVTNIKVTANYKGPVKTTQIWTWYLFDWVGNIWVRIGDNAAVTAPTAWTALQFNVTVNPTRYANNLTREVWVRLASSNAVGDAKLDYEALTITYQTCADALGCLAIRPGDPIHIAYLLNSPSLESKNGVLVAITDSAGKILNHTIKFDGVSRANCDTALSTADSQKMRKDGSIVAVIGTSCSGEAKVVMPGFAASGFSMISPSNTYTGLTQAGNPNHYLGYFRVSWPDAAQGRIAAQYAYASLGARTASTINDGSEYSMYLEQAFRDKFVALGGTVITRQAITPGTTNMSTVLSIIAASPPDMIYMPVFMPEGGYLITQARAITGLTAIPLVGSDALFTPDVGTAAGAAANGFKATAGPDTRQFNSAYAGHFVPAYTTKFGAAPTDMAFSAYGYDAFKLVKTAIVKVAVLQPDGTLLIGRKALRDALYGTKGLLGLTDTLTCTTAGDCASTPAIGVWEYHTNVSAFVRVWP